LDIVIFLTLNLSTARLKNKTVMNRQRRADKNRSSHFFDLEGPERASAGEQKMSAPKTWGLFASAIVLCIGSYWLVTKSKANLPAERSPAAKSRYIPGGFLEEFHDQINIVGALRLGVFKKWVEKNPIQMWEEMRAQAPVLEMMGVPANSPLALPFLHGDFESAITLVTKYEKTVLVANKDDVLDILSPEKAKQFSVRLYGEKMEKVMPGNFMLGKDQDPNINIAEKKFMHSILHHEDFDFIKQNAAALAEKAVEAGSEVITLPSGKKVKRFEVVNKLGRLVPIQMVGVYAGFTHPSIETMFRWSKATQQDFFRNTDDKKEISKTAIQTGKEMQDHIRKLFLKKRAERSKYGKLKTDTILDRMVEYLQTHRAESDIQPERLVILTAGMLIGAGETSQAAVTNSLVELLQNSRQQEFKGAVEAAKFQSEDAEAQKKSDELLGNYIWESLRFRPVNLVLPRTAEEDSTLHGVSIPKGSLVLASTQSAMFDDKSKDPVINPNEFRTDRAQNLYHHLGVGHHRCLGDYISLQQIPQIVKALLKKPNLRLTPEPGTYPTPGEVSENGENGVIYKQDGFPEKLYVYYDFE